jgi:putative protease
MKLTSYAHNLHDLNLLKAQGLDEVILGMKQFSRFGKLSEVDFCSMVDRAQELKLRVIFEWDILMTENVFLEAVRELPKFLGKVDALRVQDPGALFWALENTRLPLQFIAENGNHNLPALQGWKEIAEGRLERIILSLELTKEALEQYVISLNIPCELLGFGRILLFYTPRALLTPLSPEKTALNEELSLLGSSEESPHKGFPILENRHGTFMFHIKEFCLLEFSSDLKNLGLAYLRLDLRWEGMSYFSDVVELVRDFSFEKFSTFKNLYPQDLMKGFYLVNKTDVLFPKLKNNRLQKREGNFVGEVMEAEKGSHLAIMVRHPQGLKKSDKLRIVHPKGEIFELPIYSLKNVNFEDVETVPHETLALIPFVGGVWVQSQVFFLD